MADIVDIKTFFDIKKIPEEKFVWFRQRPHRVRALQIPTDFEIENWQGVDRGSQVIILSLEKTVKSSLGTRNSSNEPTPSTFHRTQEA